MASKVPITKSISWIAFAINVLLITVLAYAYKSLGITYNLLMAAATYLIMAYLLRFIFVRDEMRGMRLLKKGQFAEAIACYEKSYDFFNHHRRLDKWRMITMLSVSRMEYRKLSLNNIAFCYSQLGDGSKSLEYYDRLLSEYPANVNAIAALKMAAAFEKS